MVGVLSYLPYATLNAWSTMSLTIPRQAAQAAGSLSATQTGMPQRPQSSSFLPLMGLMSSFRDRSFCISSLLSLSDKTIV